MTTIAFRDGILAADRLITEKDTRVPGNAVKIIQNKYGWSVGLAGSVADYHRLGDWVDSYLGAPKKSKPPNPPGGEYGAIAVSPEGKVFYIERGVMFPANEDAPFVVAGAGGDIALGAMYAGASAIEAVEIASKVDTSTGNGVMWVKTATKQKEEKNVPDRDLHAEGHDDGSSRPLS
jgi:ATP-dependent protease HslVU (ClpYQ) peptidase subunit